MNRIHDAHLVHTLSFNPLQQYFFGNYSWIVAVCGWGHWGHLPTVTWFKGGEVLVTAKPRILLAAASNLACLIFPSLRWSHFTALKLYDVLVFSACGCVTLKVHWRQWRIYSYLQEKHQASLVAQLICLQCWRPQFDSWVGKTPWRRDRLPTPVFLGFPCGPAGKESACNVGDLGLIPGLGRSSGEGKGYPHQYSGLENPMDCIVLGVTKSGTRLSGFHFPGKRNQRYALFSLEIMPNHLLPNMALKIKK